ncbi:LysM peptidoglycan-binding domain-containing protein [Thermoflavifilum thermophilum]|uniref:LysM domain-containing protein n=1 Tax=Thermoflavifilum thermophilum TaxID=1393122 RepID=A0A1I7NMK6_9BACT|nr:LysM peptidoglycan-binding domain-containing protein [Thermoflavifilum thermophilum]SFV35892.1 LysM domain-containing protein [Thermoflavifilum thermophilum]
MKGICGIILFCLFVIRLASAQAIVHEQQTSSQPDEARLFIEHRVMPGETWFRLGQIYRLNPALIARANGMTTDSALRLYTQIKIPLLAENFIQPHQVPSAGYQPVFHQVKPGETLYHISRLYPSATVEDLRNWNHLSGNDIRSGQLLVVGFMRFNADALPFSSTASHNMRILQSSVDDSIRPANRNTTSLLGVIAPKPAVHGHIPPPLPAAPETTHFSLAQNTSLPINETVASSEVNRQAVSSVSTVSSANAENQVSPFLDDYLQQSRQQGWKQAEIRGAGGWFSSNIPPSSRKYYVLFNQAPRGQIIQITNPLNGKSIYAKVLDGIPKLGENANLIVKISDAAQKDLGTTQDKFFCIVHYFVSEEK